MLRQGHIHGIIDMNCHVLEGLTRQVLARFNVILAILGNYVRELDCLLSRIAPLDIYVLLCGHLILDQHIGA